MNPVKCGPEVRQQPWRRSREWMLLTVLIGITFGLRALGWNQPIVENYVGRQIPTAMVARNLERGSGFLHPALDTAPFPNYFWVEPPIYAFTVVAFHRLTGIELEPSGRLVSALAIALGAWGLYGLAKRREGNVIAFLALAIFAVFPLTLRYGRAFQPDAMLLGCFLAGFRCWDQYEAEKSRAWFVPAFFLLATAVALKVVWGTMLIAMAALIRPTASHTPAHEGTATEHGTTTGGWLTYLRRFVWLPILLLPALFWYVHVAYAMTGEGGSRASANNSEIWMRVFLPTALFRAGTWSHVTRFLCVRAFTPIGFCLGSLGILAARGGDRLWKLWGAAVLATLALLAAKLHHEYYWLMLSPIMAVGIARSLVWLSKRRICFAIAFGATFLAFCFLQSRGTWRTPAEWSRIQEAARTIQTHVPANAWVVAPEALLFESDRRGCRLELTKEAATRAVGEWGQPQDQHDPISLIAFYKRQGARYVADVVTNDSSRLLLHEAIKERYKVIVNRPGVLLAALTDPEEAPDGTR